MAVRATNLVMLRKTRPCTAWLVGLSLSNPWRMSYQLSFADDKIEAQAPGYLAQWI